MGTIAGYFLFFFLGAGIAGLINKRRRRRVVTPFAVGFAVVIIVWVADMTLAVVLASRIHDAERQGYLFGTSLFSGAVATAVSALMAHQDRKKTRAMALQGDSPSAQ